MDCPHTLGDAQCKFSGPDPGPCDRTIDDCRDRFDNVANFGGFVGNPQTISLQKWNKRFLEMALMVSTWSKDPSTKVGCVIVDSQRRVLSLGYNGFPRKIEDTPERYADRPTKYKLIVHAEANAILNATGSLEESTMYCLHLPCEECAKLIIQKGIGRVIALKQADQRWTENVVTLREAGIGVEIFDPTKGYTSRA